MSVQTNISNFIVRYKVWAFILFCVLPFVVFKVVQKEWKWKELGKRGKVVKALICEKKFLMSKRGDTVKYHYCFTLNNAAFKGGVMYKYDSNGIELNIDDSIAVAYLPDEPSENIDYLFLTSEGYAE